MTIGKSLKFKIKTKCKFTDLTKESAIMRTPIKYFYLEVKSKILYFLIPSHLTLKLSRFKISMLELWMLISVFSKDNHIFIRKLIQYLLEILILDQFMSIIIPLGRRLDLCHYYDILFDVILEI
jgi:hypothetical protein